MGQKTNIRDAMKIMGTLTETMKEYTTANKENKLSPEDMVSYMEKANKLLASAKKLEEKNTPLIKIAKLSDNATIPKKQYENDTCFDLYSSENITIQEGETHAIKTDIIIEKPEGFHCKVYGRSGLSSEGYMVTTGIIDNGYIGEVKVNMCCLASRPITIEIGDRIGQLEIVRENVFRVVEVSKESIKETERGTNGFGSTGK